VSGSRIADVTAKGKGSAPSVTRANYLAEVAAERLTGLQEPGGFQSAAMRDGKDREPKARGLYAFLHCNVPVSTVGFVLHPTFEMAGASPDTLIGDEGLAEHKCPLIATHMDWLLGGSVDGRYLKQMQWQMACTGRLWTDFVSYHPSLPFEMQLHVRRIPRDDAMIADLEKEVQAFLREVDERVDKLRKLYPGSVSEAA